MLRSMTAYGRKQEHYEFGILIWELRSVNHRYLDLSLRLPEEFRAIEPEIREYLTKNLNRGKMEVGLRYQASESFGIKIKVNHELASEVSRACHDIVNQDMRNHSLMSPMDILCWPGVVGQTDLDFRPIQKAALSLLEPTVADYINSREREGAKIVEMLTHRCEEILKIVDKVRQLRPGIIARLTEKLKMRLASLDLQADPLRLEQELVFAAQKLDVEEELDRLDAHVAELQNILNRNEPVGRRLDFLIQEFNREANTLSSKSADIDTTNLSVDLKVLIEQMREQVQNVE